MVEPEKVSFIAVNGLLLRQLLKKKREPSKSLEAFCVGGFQCVEYTHKLVTVDENELALVIGQQLSFDPHEDREFCL